MNPKKVLVTGSSGYLGSQTVAGLAARADLAVIALDVREPATRLPGVTYEIADIRAPEVDAVVGRHRPERCAVREDSRRDPDGCCIRRHVLEHDGIRANPGVVANVKRAEQLRPGSDEHERTQLRSREGWIRPSSVEPDGDERRNGTERPDGRVAIDHDVPVIEEKPGPYANAVADGYPCEEHRQSPQEVRNKRDAS